MVEALRRARAEMEKVRATTSATGQSAREAATGTGQLARAQRDNAEASTRARSETERATAAQARSRQASEQLARAKARTGAQALRATAATTAFSGAMSNAAASAALVNGPLGGVASRFSTIASLTGRMNLATVGAIAGFRPRVETRQNGDALDIDLIFGEFEGRLGRNVAQGRGLAPAIAGRFNLRGGV